MLRRHVLGEGAAVGDGKHLAAAADAEDRYALLERSLGNADFERVVLRRHRVDRRVALLAVVARIDVFAAGEHHAIKILEQLIDVAGRGIPRQGDHERARGGERLAEVALDRNQQWIGQLERDTDAGATRHDGTLSHTVAVPQRPWWEIRAPQRRLEQIRHTYAR